MNTKRKKLNKFILFVAVLYLGLLFYYITSDAESSDLMPKAGFEKFISDIDIPDQTDAYIPTCEYEYFEDPIDPTYMLTDEEVELLLKLGVLEGGGTDPEAIANVMQVVMNRVESDAFPNTVKEVIFQNNPVQFTTASKLATTNIPSEAYAAAYSALDQVIFGDYACNDAHYFESCDGLAFNSWADYSFSYGGHDFYKSRI